MWLCLSGWMARMSIRTIWAMPSSTEMFTINVLRDRHRAEVPRGSIAVVIMPRRKKNQQNQAAEVRPDLAPQREALAGGEPAASQPPVPPADAGAQLGDEADGRPDSRGTGQRGGGGGSRMARRSAPHGRCRDTEPSGLLRP